MPHSWLSSCDKIKIPHLRLRRSWGIFISSRLLSQSWGIKIEPFVICEEIIFPTFVASPLMWEKPIPISLQTGYRSYLKLIRHHKPLIRAWIWTFGFLNVARHFDGRDLSVSCKDEIFSYRLLKNWLYQVIGTNLHHLSFGASFISTHMTKIS